MTDMVTVTQADRDAAADFAMLAAECGNKEPSIRDCRDGMQDDTVIVQAFARHRIEATRDLEAKLAEARRVIEPFAECFERCDRFDSGFPDDAACLRASFDWYDRIDDKGDATRESLRWRSFRAASAFLASLEGTNDAKQG